MHAALTLYAKPGCCLCDRLREELDALPIRSQFRLEEVNILDDPELMREYGHFIPVLCVEGEEIVRLRADRETLMERLQPYVRSN